MKPIIVNSLEDVKREKVNILAMYMSRSVGTEFTKGRVEKLRKDGYVIVAILKVVFLDPNMYHIFYNKSEELKEKDNREQDRQLSAQPSVATVPNFSSNGF